MAINDRFCQDASIDYARLHCDRIAHVLSHRYQIDFFTVPSWFPNGVLCVIYIVPISPEQTAFGKTINTTETFGTAVLDIFVCLLSLCHNIVAFVALPCTAPSTEMPLLSPSSWMPFPMNLDT